MTFQDYLVGQCSCRSLAQLERPVGFCFRSNPHRRRKEPPAQVSTQTWEKAGKEGTGMEGNHA
jgi:hypothetical protein